jgi:hypothetical protein
MHHNEALLASGALCGGLFLVLVGSVTAGCAVHQEETKPPRAESADRRFLVMHGVAPERLQAVGRGATMPAEHGDTHEGRARNRRVQIIVVTP